MLHHTLAVLLIVFSNVYCTWAEGRGCITGIDLYAGTGDVSYAGSNSWFEYEFRYRTDDRGKLIQSFELYNLPGNEMTKKKGDFWSLGGTEECATADNIQETCYIKPLSGSDGWYIDDSITYGELDGDKEDLILISHNYDVNSWADTAMMGGDAVSLPTGNIERDNCNIYSACIKNIYIMAQTGDSLGAASDHIFNTFKFYLNDYEFELANLEGDDFSKHRSDLWKVSAHDAGITECLKFGSVTRAGFHHSSGIDKWEIKNAMVTVQLEDDDYALLAGNRDFNAWVDRNQVDMSLKNECWQGDVKSGRQAKDEKCRKE